MSVLHSFKGKGSVFRKQGDINTSLQLILFQDGSFELLQGHQHTHRTSSDEDISHVKGTYQIDGKNVSFTATYVGKWKLHRTFTFKGTTFSGTKIVDSTAESQKEFKGVLNESNTSIKLDENTSYLGCISGELLVSEAQSIELPKSDFSEATTK